MAASLSEWPLRRLKDITSKIGSGATPRGGKNGYKAEGISLIRSLNVYDFSFTDKNLAFIDDEQAAQLDNVTVENWDILLNITGASVARCCLVPKRILPARVNQHVAIVRVHPQIADAKFVLYCINSLHFKSRLLALAQGGATREALTKTTIEDFEVPQPPHLLQRRIGCILSAYDELMENCQRRIHILEEMARVLYREWFVHFRFPGHDKCHRVNSSVGPIPKGWEAIPFEKLLASMTGGDWGSEQPSGGDSSEVVIVRGTDFDEVAYGEELRAPIRYIKPSSLKTRGLRSGDVIIENSINAKSRCIGTTLLVDSHVLNRLGRDSVAASFCKVFRLHDPRLAPLVHLHVRRLREDARMEYYQNVAANGIGNFQAQKFAKEEHLILPTDEALRAKLIEGIAAMFRNIGVLSSQLSNLRRTRDLLLPRLLSGQVPLDVSEDVAEPTISAPPPSETDFASEEPLLRAAEEAPPYRARRKT
ncbi:MAG: restriction endonuclease subunit S [Chthoniobacterales bacterium]|nr:restriction endonuclease subunit S [Chthoniobacterales bacterium]